MIKTELVALCQQKANERKANEYMQKNNKRRKQVKMLKTVMYTVAIAFIIAGLGIVGSNDLESIGVNAKESEIETVLEVTHTENGKIKYKDLIQTEEGYLWKYDTEFPEGTEVTVDFNDNGTTNPLDDVVLDVNKR